MSLPLNKHTGARLPVCSSKHAGSFLAFCFFSFLFTRTIGGKYAKYMYERKKRVGGIFQELFLKDVDETETCAFVTSGSRSDGRREVGERQTKVSSFVNIL